MSAQAIMLAFIGVPGIYFHSLFGSRGWREGVTLTGRNRTINRQKLELATFESDLSDASSLRHRVVGRYTDLLRARRASSAFHPRGKQQVLDCGREIFGLLRLSPDGRQRVLCFHNVSGQSQRVIMNLQEMTGSPSYQFTDLITSERIRNPFDGEYVLKPYQTLWLRITE